MSQAAATVDLRTRTGRFLGPIDVDHARRYPSEYELITNQRGNVRHVKLAARTTPLSNTGKAYLQSLNNGHVWALKGVRA